MVHKIRQILVLTFLAVAFLIPQGMASAAASQFVEIPLESLHEQKPIQFQGLLTNLTLNLAMPRSWLPGEENWIEITLRRSPFLDLARSSLTIALNGVQLSSYSLEKIEETPQRIMIPAKVFTQGNNTLTFAGTLYLPEDQKTNCQNWDDPSRWLAIDPGGLLHISFSPHERQSDLSDFPQALIEPLEQYLPADARKQMLIVLPENIGQDDLTALSSLSYILGHYANANYNWQPQIVKATELNPGIIADRNVVFIGTVPTEFQTKVDTNKDYLAIYQSPWGRANSVLIIGDKNRQDGFSPASVLSDRARTILLNGNIAYVDSRLPPAPQPFQNKFSLEDLGYLDRTVRGIGQQNLIYSVYIPYDVEPTVSKLNLGLVYSPGLDVENSTFTVYLNGFSIAGILPTAKSSAGEPITIGLPARRFRRGLNFIRIAFDLHVPRGSCDLALDSVWATVLNSSNLDIAYQNRTPIPSLKHFPLPFSDYPGFSFVIPDQYNGKDLDKVARLSFLLGASAYQVNRPPDVITAANFDRKKTAYPNLILVGLPSENAITRSANDLLPQPFKVNENSLQNGYGVYLPTSDKDASLGLMQIIPSPWVKGGTVLVLTGNDSQGLEWTWDTVLNPTLQNQFSGNVMIVGSAGRTAVVQTGTGQANPQLMFQQVADASNIPIIGSILQRSGQTFLPLVFAAVGSALLLVIVVLLIAPRVQNRKSPGATGKQQKGDDNEQ